MSDFKKFFTPGNYEVYYSSYFEEDTIIDLILDFGSTKVEDDKNKNKNQNITFVGDIIHGKTELVSLNNKNSVKLCFPLKTFNNMFENKFVGRSNLVVDLIDDRRVRIKFKILSRKRYDLIYLAVINEEGNEEEIN